MNNFYKYFSISSNAASVAGFTVAAILGATAPGQTQSAWLRGEWCSGGGERMVVERSGPGFNEHTICTWIGKAPAGDKINVRIACANVYGDGQRVNEQTLRFRAVKTGPRNASVRVGSGGAVAYQKC